MGDPSGVGPEIVSRALSLPDLDNICQLVVFGDWQTLHSCARQIGCQLPPLIRIEPDDWQGSLAARDAGQAADRPGSVIVDLKNIAPELLQVGEVAAHSGQAAFDYIQAAIDAALAGIVDAVTTGPINKESLHAAGHHFPGHTEIFAQRAGSQRWCMMQYSSKITCTFVTVHCGYSEVPGLLTVQRVLDTIMLTDQALHRIRQRRPHVVVCGLNPHAGENGLFGNREEELVIAPAIQLARQQGLSVEGPVPPDTAFLPSKLAQCDAVVCMYHDQGHIPVKALAFDSAVNTTLGIPIIRTSVDHGTAFDIAWQGVAKVDSLLSAIRLAAQLATFK
jgi:4-hydroxythreonine-4-phosphate dehydrogenase